MSIEDYDFAPEPEEDETWDWCYCCDQTEDDCTCTKYCSDDFHWDIQEEIDEWDKEQTNLYEAMKVWP